MDEDCVAGLGRHRVKSARCAVAQGTPTHAPCAKLTRSGREWTLSAAQRAYSARCGQAPGGVHAGGGASCRPRPRRRLPRRRRRPCRECTAGSAAGAASPPRPFWAQPVARVGWVDARRVHSDEDLTPGRARLGRERIRGARGRPARRSATPPRRAWSRASSSSSSSSSGGGGGSPTRRLFAYYCMSVCPQSRSADGHSPSECVHSGPLLVKKPPPEIGIHGIHQGAPPSQEPHDEESADESLVSRSAEATAGHPRYARSASLRWAPPSSSSSCAPVAAVAAATAQLVVAEAFHRKRWCLR